MVVFTHLLESMMLSRELRQREIFTTRALFLCSHDDQRTLSSAREETGDGEEF